MKAQFIYKLKATREAIEKAFGQKIGNQFVVNPLVPEYATALRFPDHKVIGSGEILRALRKVSFESGSVLIIAQDLTMEARRIAIENICDVITEREFGWTDISYQNIRQNK